MKKLGILMMAMLLVCGMSLGVSAQLVENDIPITITADQMATLDHNLESVNMNITDLSVGEPFASEKGQFTVKANTDVAISVEQYYSNANEVFEGYGNWQIFWGESSNDNWIIAPNVKISSINGQGTSKDGGPSEWVGEEGRNDIKGVINESVEIINFSAGINTFELFMETSINENYDWYEFNSEESLEGELTVTVSAQ